MNISSVGSGSPITRLQGSKAFSTSQVESQDAIFSGQDTVQISDVARYLAEAKKLPEVRQDKVDSARAAIANGTLDTPEKLDVALGRFLDENA